MAETTGLLNRRTSQAYHEFESRPLRTLLQPGAFALGCFGKRQTGLSLTGRRLPKQYVRCHFLQTSAHQCPMQAIRIVPLCSGLVKIGDTQKYVYIHTDKPEFTDYG